MWAVSSAPQTQKVFSTQAKRQQHAADGDRIDHGLGEAAAE